MPVPRLYRPKRNFAINSRPASASISEAHMLKSTTAHQKSARGQAQSKTSRISQATLATLIALMSSLFTASAAVERPLTEALISNSGSSQFVRVANNPLVHTRQVLPLDENGNVVGSADVDKQASAVLQRLDEILRQATSDFNSMVKLNIYLKEEQLRPAVDRAVAKRVGRSAFLAITYVVGDLEKPDALVAMDAIGYSVSENTNLSRASSVCDRDGVSCFAVLPGGPKIYISGMADTNSLLTATRKTLEKLTTAAAHLGVEKRDIVQLKAFLQPISSAPEVRKEIVSFFGGKAPPLVFVEWIRPPPNPPIEIELIAAGKPEFANEQDSVTFLTPPGTTSTKVFSRVARVNHGRLIYFSGLYGTRSTDSGSQTREILHSLGDLLKSTGSDFEHLVKATYYVSNEEASKALNDIRSEFFNPQRPPAASKAAVKAVGAPGKTITIDMIAVTN